MISAIFQPEVSSLEFQVAALQVQLAAAQQRISLLNEAEFVAEDSLSALRVAIQKVSHLAPTAIASLKSAVLNLFAGDVKGSETQSESQPGSDHGEPEAIAVEILTGQHSEWASPWACSLDDAPASALNGQFVDLYQIAYSRDGFKYLEPADQEQELSSGPILEEISEMPYVEFVGVGMHLHVGYQRKSSTGEIICAYLGGNNKSKLKGWGEWLCHQHTVGSGFELREAKQLTTYKYEIKIWGMSLEQIERLAGTDTTKSPPSNYGSAQARKCEPVAPAPKLLTLDDIGIGDIVRSKMVKQWEYKVLGITEGGFLDVERIGVTPQIRLGGLPEGFELVSKAVNVALTEEEISIGNESIQPPDDVRRKPIDDLFTTNTCDVTGYSANPIGRAGAQKNWEILQAKRAEERLIAQTAVLELPQPASVEQEIVAGDWVELLVTGDRYQVESVDDAGLHLADYNYDGNLLVPFTEVKLLMHVPDSWKPF